MKAKNDSFFFITDDLETAVELLRVFLVEASIVLYLIAIIVHNYFS
jgi:hypothetical protein